MLALRDFRRFISIGIALSGLALITVLYVGTSTSTYYIDVQKVQNFLAGHPQLPAPPRILCLILTSPIYFATRVKAVNTTWAPRCDRYFFIAESLKQNMTAQQISVANSIPIAPIANIIGGYDHLTQKSNLALLFAYENYRDDFDWFVKADDDTYLIVDHLRTFLSKQNASEPVTFGYNFKVEVPKGYHSGGASYVLSRESLRRFHEAHQDPQSSCRKDGGSEDVEVARCLRSRGVYPGKSVDEQNRELFHPLPFIDHFRGSIPDWLDSYAENAPQSGVNCCGDQSISFHYVTPTEQYLMDFLLYRARSPTPVHAPYSKNNNNNRVNSSTTPVK